MTQIPFDKRLSRLRSKHRRLAAGVTYRIGPDGLMIPVPGGVVARRLPVRGALLLLAMLYGFKLLLFVGLGEGAYEDRLAGLGREGAGGAVAWVMRPDAAMRAAATVAPGWLRGA